MAGILTAIGEAKVAASFGGTPLTLATIRVGDGNGAPITPNRLMTDLVRRVGAAYPITLSARDNDTPTMWRVRSAIPPGSGPFTVREIAVFDSAGDMIAIASLPAVEFLGAGGDVVSMVLDLVFPVSGQANVSVSLSQDILVPLAQQLRPCWLTINSVLNAPPANPILGATYIIGAAPTGAWVGLAGAIAQWDGADWAITTAPVGHIVADASKAESDPLRYLKLTGAGWASAAATDVAFGFSRQATAAELAAGSGDGFLNPTNIRNLSGLTSNLKVYTTSARQVLSAALMPGITIFSETFLKKSPTSILVMSAAPSIRLVSVASTTFIVAQIDGANDFVQNHYLISNNSGKNFQPTQFTTFSWFGIPAGSRNIQVRVGSDDQTVATITINPNSIDSNGWVSNYKSTFTIYEVEP